MKAGQGRASTTAVIGLCGFRCSGKSFVRDILIQEHSVPVFDTDSIETGDPDADTISPMAILARYGRGESYIHFLAPYISQALADAHGLLVIDSLKAPGDRRVLQSYHPLADIRVLWVHSPFALRNLRYTARDVATGRRGESLVAHDEALIGLGVLQLLADADYVLSNVFGEEALRSDLIRVLADIRQGEGGAGVRVPGE